ncbi:aminopeptidase [Desulfovibrio inopinatus]|uniref:aminopeptidase n=1 Tax=Desulfovibrio inopinatus TaxID=102109 RepID=UPI000401B92C|nr:aminopeptidase [Desulfovibrio inopinatus]
MYSKSLLEKYADVLVWGLTTSRTSAYAEGDIVLLQFQAPALKLAEALYTKLLERGIHPVFRMGLTAPMERDLFMKGNDDQVTFYPPGTRELYESLNGTVYILSPDSLTHLQHVNSKRIAAAAVARKPYRDILNRREEEGLLGWTLCLYPTPELAKYAGLSLDEYGNQIAKACMLDQSDPTAAWKTVFEEANTIKTWLNSLRATTFHVESDDIDLTVSMGKFRRFIGISGHNIPSFEIFTSPDWRYCSGTFYADQPSYRSGNLVRGVRLTFDNGRAVSVSAEEGEDFVKEQLAMDDGANKIGEFSLTDKRFSKIDAFMANTLFDENYGGENGNCHIAVGSAYTDTYTGDPVTLTSKARKELGYNDSALHWDLVNTQKKRVRAKLESGEWITVYDDGQFTY